MQLCPECGSDYLEYDQGVLKAAPRPVHVWMCPACGYAVELTPDERKQMVENRKEDRESWID